MSDSEKLEVLLRTVKAIDNYLSSFSEPLAETIKGITSHALAKIGETE